MAKKRAKRRRRVGAASLNMSSPMIKLAAVAGGYFLAATPVNNAIDGLLSKIMPASASPTTVPAGNAISDTGKYVAIAAEGGLAYFLLMKGKSSMIKTLAGGVLGGAALKRALQKFGVVTGYQNVPVIGGYQNVPVIGMRQPSTGYGVNGIEQPGTGYGVNGRGTSTVMGCVNDGE